MLLFMLLFPNLNISVLGFDFFSHWTHTVERGYNSSSGEYFFVGFGREIRGVADSVKNASFFFAVCQILMLSNGVKFHQHVTHMIYLSLLTQTQLFAFLFACFWLISNFTTSYL